MSNYLHIKFVQQNPPRLVEYVTSLLGTHKLG